MVNAASSCPVCGATGMVLIYNSDTDTSLSSLCQILPGAKTVSFCEDCGHLSGNGVDHPETFYETDYRILLDDEDEDQIYVTRGDEIVTRTDHQMAVLTQKIELKPGISVLDYGCAKAAMARKIISAVPGIDMHVFDVSRMYEPFWDKFVAKDRQAIHETAVNWNERFDLVTSFFALEHITDPRSAMGHISRLLRPGGQFYMIVPDVTGNAADFIVIDHVNHFTTTSAARLMADAGFGEIVVDAQSHRGAIIVTARKPVSAVAESNVATDTSPIRKKAHELAAFWSTAADAVRANEARADREKGIAIYGSGFYGAFIYANLERPETVTCFLDQSPWQQGKSMFGVPIIAPQDMSADVGTVFVGLNPVIARDVMSTQPWFGRDELMLIYLKDREQ